MVSPAPAHLQKSFPLDPAILGAGSAVNLELGGASSTDVVSAIATNRPFPARPDGVIGLAEIGLTVSGGNPVAFEAGGVSVGFNFRAGVTAGAAVFDRADD